MTTSSTIEVSGSLLKEKGYSWGIVERFDSRRTLRFDFCGFGDIIGFRPMLGSDLRMNLEVVGFNFLGCLCVQTCSTGSVQGHVRKVCEGKPRHDLRKWLECGANRFEIWGWKRKSLEKVCRVVVDSNGEFQTYGNSELECFA